MKSNQQGFTLVELVVVMVILGVLAATALPKFMDVSDQAHEAAVAGTGGALGSAIAMIHAQWVAEGNTTGAVGTGADNLKFGAGDIDTNNLGWPVDTAGVNTALGSSVAKCELIWNAAMQNPPTVAGGDYTTTAGSNICTYTYQAADNMSISYDSTNGNVTVDSDSSS